MASLSTNGGIKMARARTRLAFGLLVMLGLGSWPARGAEPAVDQAAVDKAFETLKTYDWGSDRSGLRALEVAVAAGHADAAAARKLEARLAAVLKEPVTSAAKDFVCRQLSLVGTAESVPALAALLTDKELTGIARYGLEPIPGPEASAALRQALAAAEGLAKVGIINSLGVRRDAESITLLTGLAADQDAQVAVAAVVALGAIGTSDAAKVLADLRAGAAESLRGAVADASLVCAEHLRAADKKVEALAIYKALAAADQPKHIRLAATRGLLAVTGQK
jgi:hypothetical protein